MSAPSFPAMQFTPETCSVELADAVRASDSAVDMGKYSDPFRAALEMAADHGALPIQATKEHAARYKDWLPFAAEAYSTSKDLENYVLVPVPIFDTDIPNRNLVAFPFSSASAFNPDTGSLNYQTFRGMPTHVDHCFPAEAPVLTPHGERPIAGLKVGDYVVTHKGRNKRVTRLFKNGVKPVREIDITGYPESMMTTDNHPIFVADARQVYDHIQITFGSFGAKNSGQRGLKMERDIRVHQRPASDVYPGDYVCVPRKVFGGKKAEHPSLCFLVGVYAAEGSLRRKGNYRNTILTLGAKETALRDEVVAACEDMGYEVAVSYRSAVGKGGSISPSVCGITIKSRAFYDLCQEAIGTMSGEKSLKSWVRNLDRDSLLRFIGGYLSGDGYLRAGGRNDKSRKGSSSTLILTTVSRQMAADLFYAYISLGMSPMFMASADARTMKGFGWHGKYDEREYDCLPAFHVKVSREDVKALWPYLSKSKTKGKRFHLATGRRLGNCVAHSFWHGNTYFMRVRDVTPNVKKVPVFNIEVEDDHTYIAYGAAVHNCNSDFRRAKGLTLDVGMRRRVDTDYPNLWRVMTLCAFDRSRDAKLANQIMTGEVNSYSMGAFVRGYTCSICGSASPRPDQPKCLHIPSDRKRMLAFKDTSGNDILAHWKCGPFKGFEVSALVHRTPGAFPSTDNTTKFMTLRQGKS